MAWPTTEAQKWGAGSEKQCVTMRRTYDAMLAARRSSLLAAAFVVLFDLLSTATSLVVNGQRALYRSCGEPGACKLNVEMLTY